MAPALWQFLGQNGVIRVRSAYFMDQAVARVRADIAAKGILSGEFV